MIYGGLVFLQKLSMRLLGSILLFKQLHYAPVSGSSVGVGGVFEAVTLRVVVGKTDSFGCVEEAVDSKLLVEETCIVL